MAYSDLLINTCDIQRFTEGAQDVYGNPLKVWANLHTGAACRWSTPRNREIKVGAEVVVADLELFLLDIDVTEQDRVTLNGLTYQVLSSTRRQNGIGSHHRECLLQVVK